VYFSLAATTLLFSIVTSSVLPVADPPQPNVTSISPAASPEATVHTVMNISGIGFEDLAFRANGEILATTAFPSALLWYIDPLSIRPPILLHNFTSLATTSGIIELAPDMFYVVGSGDDSPHNIYSVNMRPFLALPNGSVVVPPVIHEIGGITSPFVLNGMTHLHKSDNFVLIADTLLGGVWKLDVVTGKSNLVIQDITMQGPPNQTSFAAFGINGVRTQNNTLFYTNSGKESMYKMPVGFLFDIFVRCYNPETKPSADHFSRKSSTKIAPPPATPR